MLQIYNIFFDMQAKSPFFSPFKITPSPIPRGAHRKMNPDDATLLPYQQFVEVFAAHIADVQQDGSIAQSLFHPYAADVHGAPRQVVRRVRQVPVPCAPTQVPP